MNRQEAIEELKRMASTIEWDYPLDAQIAIEKAIDALQDPWVSVETSLPEVGQAVQIQVARDAHRWTSLKLLTCQSRNN